jgi:3-oxoacyl-[acyl-carrier protein] reductase
MSSAAPHVIVSGGTRGLGQAIVRDLLGDGYVVSTFGRSRTEFVAEMEQAFASAFAFDVADISSPGEVAAVTRRAHDRFGAPYGLVNNAGVAEQGVLATVDFEQIERVLAINLAGTLYLSRQVLRSMLLQRKGRVVNISSIIGLRGYAGLAVYSATKAGIDGMTRALAREVGPRGITVNSVAPGYLETEMTHGLDDEQRRQIIRRTPLGRLGAPEHVTGLVRFLLSDAAQFITGQVIAVDGGITC